MAATTKVARRNEQRAQPRGAASEAGGISVLCNLRSTKANRNCHMSSDSSLPIQHPGIHHRLLDASRDDRYPCHSLRRTSSWKPLISLNPRGPEIIAMSFHFSYRLNTSRGTASISFSNPRCSSILHMPQSSHIQYGMSRNCISRHTERSNSRTLLASPLSLLSY